MLPRTLPAFVLSKNHLPGMERREEVKGKMIRNKEKKVKCGVRREVVKEGKEMRGKWGPHFHRSKRRETKGNSKKDIEVNKSMKKV